MGGKTGDVWRHRLQSVALRVMFLSNKIHWHLNDWITRHLKILEIGHGNLTVIDQFSTPGDTIMTATVCRILKQNFPGLRINCQTKNPDIIRLEPGIDTLNHPAGPWVLNFQYLEIVHSKNGSMNVLKPVMDHVGIRDYTYTAKIHLSGEEIESSRQKLSLVPKPIITINVLSKEMVKVWKISYWQDLVERLKKNYAIVQLGDKKEPVFPGITSFAGQLSFRESMAILSHAALHIGPDSFLMHAANGLKIPSIIIFGGSRTPANFGYADNINLYAKVPCGPCFLHDSLGQFCPHDIMCMDHISVEDVMAAVQKLLSPVATQSREPN